MQTTETSAKRYTPGSVPVVGWSKVYYAADIEAAGGPDAFLESIGSDKAKLLPEIDFSETEWEDMLKEDV